MRAHSAAGPAAELWMVNGGWTLGVGCLWPCWFGGGGYLWG